MEKSVQISKRHIKKDNESRPHKRLKNMCGIVGILASTSQSEARLIDTVRTMADTLAHRGPDANGLWVDPEAGLALGHRRLSILELSSLGNQPMVSSCGRYVLCHKERKSVV